MLHKHFGVSLVSWPLKFTRIIYTISNKTSCQKDMDKVDLGKMPRLYCAAKKERTVDGERNGK
jgi:hypothetical protein